MSRHLTTFRSTVLVALLAATGAIGIAQTAAAPQVAPTAPAAPTAAAASPAPSQAAGLASRANRHARMAEHHQQRLDQLKSRLQLTPEQEPAWRAYLARTGPGSYAARSADRADKAERPWRSDLASLSTPERIEQMKAWQAERDAARQQRMDATLSFYRALDPKQQQVFDQVTASGFMRAGMKAGGHGGKHRHGHHGDHGHQGQQHPAAPKS